MAAVAAICTLALAVLVVVVVSAPLRRRTAERKTSRDGEPGGTADTELERTAAAADLDAAREVTYRELRDAELDYRTGKLSEPDFRAVDAELKAQALELLDQIERQEAAREDH